MFLPIHQPLKSDAWLAEVLRGRRRSPLSLVGVPPVEKHSADDDRQVGAQGTARGKPPNHVIVPFQQPDMYRLREVLLILGAKARGPADLTNHLRNRPQGLILRNCGHVIHGSPPLLIGA